MIPSTLPQTQIIDPNFGIKKGQEEMTNTRRIGWANFAEIAHLSYPSLILAGQTFTYYLILVAGAEHEWQANEGRRVACQRKKREHWQSTFDAPVLWRNIVSFPGISSPYSAYLYRTPSPPLPRRFVRRPARSMAARCRPLSRPSPVRWMRNFYGLIDFWIIENETTLHSNDSTSLHNSQHAHIHNSHYS